MEGPATCPMGPGDTVFGRSRNYLGALGLCDGGWTFARLTAFRQKPLRIFSHLGVGLWQASWWRLNHKGQSCDCEWSLQPAGRFPGVWGTSRCLQAILGRHSQLEGVLQLCRLGGVGT